MDTIKDRIYYAACKISNQTMSLALNDTAEMERCLKIYSEAWMNGVKFYTGDAVGTEAMNIKLGVVKREPDCDEEKEIESAAAELVSALRKANVRRWLSGITREQMVALGNALGRDAFVVYSDAKMGVVDMARRWSDVHEGEKEIVICGDDMLP